MEPGLLYSTVRHAVVEVLAQSGTGVVMLGERSSRRYLEMVAF